MNSLHPAEVPAPHDDHWISLLQHPSRQMVIDAALVLDAVGIDQRTHRVDDLWHLLVRPTDAPEARLQIASYLRENTNTKKVQPAPVPQGNGWYGVAAFLGVIWMLPWLEGQFGYQDLRLLGTLHAAAVRDGAWWQTVTALTLHADLGHVVANSLFGSLFGYLLARFLGAGVGWLLAILSAIAANYTNACIQADAFHALGASTAVFAALGLVGAFGWQRRYFASGDRRRRFAPAFAAIAMIAFTGTSGERIDLFGHLFGFAYGFTTGYIFARWTSGYVGLTGQWLAGFGALLLLSVAWAEAI